jgi:hypothetical protein
MTSKNTKLVQYAVYRHGANASNQGMTGTLLVAIVSARNAEEACEVEAPAKPTVYDSAWLKADPSVTVWANQRLTAEPVSRTSKSALREFNEGK